MEQEIPKDLLALLCCPKCRKPVAPDRSSLVCTNPECGLRYPVKEGIPVMLIEEAEKPDAPPKAPQT